MPANWTLEAFNAICLPNLNSTEQKRVFAYFVDGLSASSFRFGFEHSCTSLNSDLVLCSEMSSRSSI